MTYLFACFVSLGCNIGYGYLHRIPKRQFPSDGPKQTSAGGAASAAPSQTKVDGFSEVCWCWNVDLAVCVSACLLARLSFLPLCVSTSLSLISSLPVCSSCLSFPLFSHSSVLKKYGGEKMTKTDKCKSHQSVKLVENPNGNSGDALSFYIWSAFVYFFCLNFVFVCLVFFLNLGFQFLSCQLKLNV